MSDIPGKILHPKYTKHATQLSTVQAVYDGIDSAKVHIQKYSQEEDKEYEQRQEIATLDNFVFRTVDDIVNLIFRKGLDTTGVTDANLKTYIDKIDYTNNLNSFAKTVLANRIRDGHTFILVDSPSYDPEQVTLKSQQLALGIRPYLVNVERKNVLSWKKNSKGEYTQVIIKETYETEGKYSVTTGERIKVWNSDGTVETWEDDEKTGTISTGLTRIPLVKVGKDDVPPLYGMAKINITHMNRDSEVSNYARIGGAAFLAVFGLTSDEKAPKTLGITKGISFKDKSISDIRWVEMEGKNYEMLKDRILYHEDQMDRIAVSFTTEQQNKTATQVEKESATGESKAISYATGLEEGLNTALSYMGLYHVNKTLITGSTVAVNKDLDSNKLTPDMVASYRTDYLSGLISYERLIKILIAGEYFKDMTDDEIAKEKALLLDSPGV